MNEDVVKEAPASIISRQLDREKIDALASRVDSLLESNNSLR
jgi:hypothetical protein